MLRTVLLALLLTQAAAAQSGPPAASSLSPMDAFKKEYAALQKALDDAVDSSVPGAEVLQPARATYLEEFGIVLTVEVVLERPVNNPFSNPRTQNEIRMSMAERRKLLQEGVETLLKLKAGTLQSISATQSVVIVVYIFNPAAVPNLPTQIQFIAKKQTPTKIIIREF